MARKIVNTEGVCGGSPRIDRTRLTCANVVLTLSDPDMSLKGYLSCYSYLDQDDIKACVAYCAGRQCLDDGAHAFCEGCTLDDRPVDPVLHTRIEDGVMELCNDAEFDDEAVDVWEYAAKLRKDFGK